MVNHKDDHNVIESYYHIIDISQDSHLKVSFNYEDNSDNSYCHFSENSNYFFQVI